MSDLVFLNAKRIKCFSKLMMSGLVDPLSHISLPSLRRVLASKGHINILQKDYMILDKHLLNTLPAH